MPTRSIQNSYIQNSPKLETIRISIDSRMEKQVILYSYSRILYHLWKRTNYWYMQDGSIIQNVEWESQIEKNTTYQMILFKWWPRTYKTKWGWQKTKQWFLVGQGGKSEEDEVGTLTGKGLGRPQEQCWCSVSGSSQLVSGYRVLCTCKNAPHCILKIYACQGCSASIKIKFKKESMNSQRYRKNLVGGRDGKLIFG